MKKNNLTAILKFLIYFLFIVFPLGQLVRINTSIPELVIYPQDILVFLVGVVWFLNNGCKKILKKDLFGKQLFAFLAIAFFSLLVNYNKYGLFQLLVSSLYLLRLSFYSLLYFVFRDIKKKKFLYYLFFSIFVSAVLGLIQYFFWPDFTYMEALGWDPHLKRLVGTWFDPGFTSIIYVLGILLVLNLFEKNHYLLYFFFTIVYSALALTYARSGYVAYITAVILFALLKKNYKMIFVLLTLSILTLVILPKPPDTEGVKLARQATIWSRINSIQNGLIIAEKQPLFGIGFNALRYVKKEFGFIKQDWRNSHSGAGIDNSIIFILATTGVTGLISYSRFYLTSLKKSFYSKKYKKLLIPVLTAILLHSLINNTLFYAPVMLLLFFFLSFLD